MSARRDANHKRTPRLFADARAAPEPPSDEPLRVRIVGDRLIISIGVGVLAFAFERSEFNNPFDEAAGEFSQTYRVTDAKVFAKEVLLALDDEGEDGSTPVRALLDKACKTAIEDGCEGVEP